MRYQIEIQERAARKELAKEISEMVKKSKKKPIMVAVGGIPCAGKTMFARMLRDELKEAHDVKAVIVQQDGYHYYRSQLDKMEDPVLAHSRRGAPFTYDS